MMVAISSPCFIYFSVKVRHPMDGADSDISSSESDDGSESDEGSIKYGLYV